MARWPQLPKQVFDVAGGAIDVLEVVDLTHEDGDKCDGLWDEVARTISLEASLPLERQWWTFYHERMEMILSDSGLDNMVPEKLREAICSGYATAEQAQMRRERRVKSKPTRQKKAAP